MSSILGDFASCLDRFILCSRASCLVCCVPLCIGSHDSCNTYVVLTTIRYSQDYLTSYFSTRDALAAVAIRRQPADTHRPMKRAEEMMDENLAKRARVVEVWPSLFTLAARGTSIFDETAVNVEERVPLGQKVPTERIYIRYCYKELCSSVLRLLERGTEVILTGSPGIGKSLFGVLFVIEVIRMRASELLSGALEEITHLVYEHRLTEHSVSTFYVIHIEGKSIKEVDFSDVRTYVWNSLTLLVKDGACQHFDHKCPSLWISSPRPKALRKLGEEIGVCSLCVPPFEVDEMVSCYSAKCAPSNLFDLENCAGDHPARIARDEAYSQVDDTDEHCIVSREIAAITRWAADLGPCVRRVFNPIPSYIKQQGALGELGERDYEIIEKIATIGTEVADQFKQSHILVTMCTAFPFFEYFLAPASKVVLSRMWDLKQQRDMSRAESMMGRLEGARLGLIYESYCHEKLCDGKGFKATARLLGGPPGSWGIGEEREFDFGKLQRRSVSTAEFSDHSPADRDYCVPDDPAFPTVDAWTTQGMFQMTVASTHPIKSGAKSFKALKDKNVPNRIFFVVPVDMYHSYTAQKLVLGDGSIPSGDAGPRDGWNDLEQWVIGLWKRL